MTGAIIRPSPSPRQRRRQEIAAFIDAAGMIVVVALFALAMAIPS